MNKVFLPEAEIAINGVFHYLTQHNILNQYVSAFSSKEHVAHKKENIFNLDPAEFYASEDEALNQHVGFIFHQHQFVPYAYTLVRYDGDGFILKEWSLKGSLSRLGEDWEEIEFNESREVAQMCEVGPLPTYYIRQKYWKPYVRFKIENTGKTCSGTEFLRVGGIEMFGELRASCQFFNPCTRYFSFTHFSFRPCFFLLVQPC